MKHEEGKKSLFPICQVRVSRLYDLYVYVNCPVSFYFSAPARHLPRHIIASLPASSMPLHRQCGSLAGPEQNGELPGFPANPTTIYIISQRMPEVECQYCQMIQMGRQNISQNICRIECRKIC